MKKFATFLAIVAAVLFSAGLVISAEAPEKITIKFVQKTRPPVEFPHKAHIARAKNCQECHHKNEAGKEEKCSNCHKAKTEGKVVEFKEAMHTKCKDCHKKHNGPTKCDDCHKKK
ncbi:MAG: cytochrome c3 family protein [Deltaproteobacteria bacterium]|nr:cytochrome c3 family protein [Deltaproteobacteria bacterium]